MAILRNHVCSTDCVQVVYLHNALFDAENTLLAGISRGTTGGRVVVEKAIQASPINIDEFRGLDPETPCALASCERWVGINNVCSEWVRCIRIGLVVGSLSLNEAHEDVTSVDELVLVQRVVLNCGAIKPDSAQFGFDE